MITRVPDTNLGNGFFAPVICGALAAVRLPDRYVVLNWKAQKMLIPDGSPESFFIELIPQHILLEITTNKCDVEIHPISDDDVFRSQGIPIIDLDAVDVEFISVSPDHIPKLQTYRDPAWNAVQAMSVCKSPVHEDKYRVWLYGCDDTTTSNINFVWSFDLLVAGGQQPQLRQRPSACRPAPRIGSLCSYSGQVLARLRNGVGHILPDDNPVDIAW